MVIQNIVKGGEKDNQLIKGESMEVFNNKDKSVTKYLHIDGSETCIKIVPSSYYVIDKNNKLIKKKKERHKYSVLISHSSGCPIGCKMCYLTIKGYPYHPLRYYEITSNVIRAIQDKVRENPDLKSKYIKLCWMGMGDAFLDLMKVKICTDQILDFVFKNKYAAGLDGVDIGTVFPKASKDLHILNWINQSLERHYWTKSFGKNPYNTDKSRSPLRIFYSLHNFGWHRENLIPHSKDLLEIKGTLKSFKELCNIDVIFHHLLLDKVNDSKAWIYELKDKFNFYFKDFELRILRYNECKDSPYKESIKFDEIINELNKSIPMIKYQISPGSEIKAACGQFIMKEFK